jgi:predicted acyltransferase
MHALPARQNGSPAAGRIVSLDVFRGLTVSFMILVNNPGTWDAIYDPFEHAPWHGLTPTDVVFPVFLFIVGISITTALAPSLENRGNRSGLYLKMARRSLIIFVLGIVLTGFPDYDLSTLRIPGVLQRIAVCYLVVALIFLNSRWRTQAWITAGILVFYWIIMTFIPVPGFGAGNLEMEGNVASFVDRSLLAGHTFEPLYDPEGVLSTVPAIATTLCGVLTGHLLRSKHQSSEKVAAMYLAGMIAMLAGWTWNFWFPINKALWTSSYVLLTAGIAAEIFAFCYWVIDVKGYRAWSKPFVVFGTNALVVYFLAELVSMVMSTASITQSDGNQVDLKTVIYETVFAWWAQPKVASLMFAICTVLLWFGVMAVLYRRRIFVKV